jgi:hypothetical protein
LQPIPLVLQFLFGLQPVLLTLALPATLLDVKLMRVPGNVFMREQGGNDRLRMRGIPHLLSGVHLLASRLIVVLVHRGIFLSESEHRLSNTYGCPWLSDRAAAPHGAVPSALPDQLQTRQGREPVFYKLEQIIKASDGEDALDCWSDTAERQLVPTVLQQPLHLQEPGKAGTPHNIRVREINHDITIAPVTHHSYDRLQLVLFLQFPGQIHKDHVFRPTVNTHS